MLWENSREVPSLAFVRLHYCHCFFSHLLTCYWAKCWSSSITQACNLGGHKGGIAFSAVNTTDHGLPTGKVIDAFLASVVHSVGLFHSIPPNPSLAHILYEACCWKIHCFLCCHLRHSCISYGSDCFYLFISNSSKFCLPSPSFMLCQGQKSGWRGGNRTTWAFGNSTLASYTQNKNRERKCLY